MDLVTLRTMEDYGSAMMLAPGARDRLRELLDRAAMPGQAGGPGGD